ncbi:MAG: hypothetical protein IPK73_30975 [Candidatus Obscuribacter sp.]|nr:hypothetical protein [Candidatus Obscuribacter sp.]
MIEQSTTGHGTVKTTYDDFNRVLSKELVGLGTETWTYSAMANEALIAGLRIQNRMPHLYP